MYYYILIVMKVNFLKANNSQKSHTEKKGIIWKHVPKILNVHIVPNFLKDFSEKLGNVLNI